MASYEFGDTLTLDGVVYHVSGTIVDNPVITRRFVETFWGPVAIQDVSVTFMLVDADASAAFPVTSDLRGFPFTLWRVDRLSTARLREWSGTIVATTRGRGTLTLHGTNLDLSILEEQIPKGTIDPTRFPLAVDAGKVPAWVFGRAVDLTLLNVRDDLPKSQFDYVICRGTLASIESVRRRGPSANVAVTPSECSKPDGTTASTWADALRTDLYPGFSALRFKLRQTDTNGNFYTLTATVNGLMAETNAARAVRTMLSDATNGLGRLVDSASFDQAEVDAAMSYGELICADGPSLLYRFNEPFGPPGAPCTDVSGHGHHGVYNGPEPTSVAIGDPDAYSFGRAWAANGEAASYPSVNLSTPDVLMGPNGITVECWYMPLVTSGPNDGNHTPVLCLSNDATRWSYALIIQARAVPTIYFGWQPTTPVGGPAYVGLTFSAAAQGTWLHIVGTATPDGHVTLTVSEYLTGDGTVPSATYTYAGRPTTGPLQNAAATLYIAHLPDALAVEVPRGAYDNVAIYPYVLSSAQIMRHANYGRRATPRSDGGGQIPLDYRQQSGVYGQPGTPAEPKAHYWTLDESSSGSADIGAVGGSPSVYQGTLTTNQPGALSDRNVQGTYPSITFPGESSGAGYCVIANPTLTNPNAFTVALWYKPAALIPARGALFHRSLAGAAGVTAPQQSGVLLIHADWANPGVIGIFVWNATDVINQSSSMGFYWPTFTAADIGRWTHIVATFSTASNRLALYKNGVPLVAQQGIMTPWDNRAGPTYLGAWRYELQPAYFLQGGLDEVATWNVELTAAQIAQLYLSGSWAPGGLRVDGALAEARQAQDWLRQVLMLRGMRLGMSPDGKFTLAVDRVPPPTIKVDARDGPGLGARTLLDATGRAQARLDDTVKTLIVQYQRDLLNPDVYKSEIRRTVHASLGRDRLVPCDLITNNTSADRLADYLAKRLLASEETVDVVLTQEARQLREGDLIQLTDPWLGYDHAVREVKEVRAEQKQIAATVQGWTTGIYDYAPGPFPPKA